MPNPYDPAELTRQAQQRQLTGGATSNTMPVDNPRNAGVVAVAPRGSAPSGFDQTNWSNPAMQSVKYRAGRLLAGARKPSEVAAIVGSPEFQSTFKGATFDGKDRVNFQGALSDGSSGVPVYDIDVLMGADRDADSSNGFWWGHDVPGMNQGPSSGGGGGGAVDMSQFMANDNDALARIMEELSAAQQGQGSPAERDAMIAMLQGGMI